MIAQDAIAVLERLRADWSHVPEVEEALDDAIEVLRFYRTDSLDLVVGRGGCGECSW